MIKSSNKRQKVASELHKNDIINLLENKLHYAEFSKIIKVVKYKSKKKDKIKKAKLLVETIFSLSF